MDTIRSVLTAITGSEHDNTPLPASNELIRHPLCKVDELQNGQMKEFEIRTPIITTSVLLIKQNNKFYAYASKCCHAKVSLAKGLMRIFLLCF